MKEKGIRIGFCVILSFILLYFFTCSLIGEYFIYHGRTRKIVYLLLVFLVSLIVTILLDRNTSYLREWLIFRERSFIIEIETDFIYRKQM